MPAGTRLLARGQPNSSLFLLRSGLADVRLQRGPVRETLARLRPPAMVGEILFPDGTPVLRGRRCRRRRHDRGDPGRGAGFVYPTAGTASFKVWPFFWQIRLGDANAVHRPHRTTPVVLLQLGATWSAPTAFPELFVRALAKEAGGDVLWLTPAQDAAPASLRQRSDRVWEGTLGRASDSGAVRDALAEALPYWTDCFRAIVIACRVSESSAGEAIRPFATHVGTIAGPQDAAPEYAGKSFLLREANGIALAKQTVHARLVRDGALAERAVAEGSSVPAAFAGVVESAARAGPAERWSRRGRRRRPRMGPRWRARGTRARRPADRRHRGIVDGVDCRRARGAGHGSCGFAPRHGRVAATPPAPARAARVAHAPGERARDWTSARALLRRPDRADAGPSLRHQRHRHRAGRGTGHRRRAAATCHEGVDGISRVAAAGRPQRPRPDRRRHREPRASGRLPRSGRAFHRGGQCAGPAAAPGAAAPMADAGVRNNVAGVSAGGRRWARSAATTGTSSSARISGTRRCRVSTGTTS